MQSLGPRHSPRLARPVRRPRSLHSFYECLSPSAGVGRAAGDEFDEFDAVEVADSADFVAAADSAGSSAAAAAAAAAASAGSKGSVGDATAAAAAAAAAPRPAEGLTGRKSYEVEILAGAGLLLYVALFFWGQRKNRQMADAWLEAFRPLLTQQFARISVTADPSSPFMKESHNGYRFYASGREHCRGMLASLDLLPRHDLLGWAMASFSKQEDLLTLEFPMNDRAVPTMVFAIVPKRKRRALQTECGDLTRFPHVMASEKLPAELGAAWDVLLESNDIFRDLIDDATLQTLLGKTTTTTTNGGAGTGKGRGGSAASATTVTNPAVLLRRTPFRFLHVTDQGTLSKSNVGMLSDKIVRLQFRLPAGASSAEAMEEVRPMMELAFELVDRLAEFRLSEVARKRTGDARKDLEEDRERLRREEVAEQIRKKKEEKRIQEEERMRELDSETQAKLRERQWKEEMKKKMKPKLMRVG